MEQLTTVVHKLGPSFQNDFIEFQILEVTEIQIERYYISFF